MMRGRCTSLQSLRMCGLSGLRSWKKVRIALRCSLFNPTTHQDKSTHANIKWLKWAFILLQWCGSTAISCTSTIPAPGWMVCGCAANRKSNRPWAAGCWTTKMVRMRFSQLRKRQEERVNDSAGGVHRVHVQTVSAKGIQEAPPSHSNRGDTRRSTRYCTKSCSPALLLIRPNCCCRRHQVAFYRPSHRNRRARRWAWPS